MSLTELRHLIARHAEHADGLVDGLLLSRTDWPTAPTVGMAEPVMALVVQGRKRLMLGDLVYDYGAGQYLVVTVDLPVTGHCTQATPEEPLLGFGLVLKPARIASLLLEASAAAESARPAGPQRLHQRADTRRRPGDTGHTDRAIPHGLAVSDAPADLVDAVTRMVRLLDHPDDAPILAPMLEKEILWRLVTGEQGMLVRQIGLADSRLTQISRAIHWIREHHTQTLRVEDLAHVAGMSVSPFHRHFRAVTAMTPIQYQKRIRLQEARLMLMSSTEDVATVGFAVGYDSASQFSREYRRHFGTPPGADAARLRRQPAGNDAAEMSTV
ncbi:AraC family transcriptional regulator [Streptomyces sp. NPDC051896]|uniref:AraC family transcriptional regulator n=1 Tax=Streptomyces sp. NPDC051896 TaxID=3155416 RepID=UPI003439FF7B